MAVWIPLWHEAAVIRRMLEHNLAAIRYQDYEFFVGVYRNDPETRAEVEAVAARNSRVHLAEVPHDGPTMKSDCLNWVYQRMLAWELETGRRMEVVIFHDAEDVIHPRALELVNAHTETADMVQMPVLPIETGWREWTHGLYCDDFAESQGKDLETRVNWGGFLPGCGVGTALTRNALDALASRQAGQILQPAALTEDYDLGVRLHCLGFRQKFVPLQWDRGVPVATREYFPRSAPAAIRQRTRWVTGNSLQAWHEHGWGRGMSRRRVQAWFFWRDRKGLWGNPLSLACNFLFLWGLLSWTAGSPPWFLSAGHSMRSALALLMGANLALLLERLAARTFIVATIYGWQFASGAPFRLIWGNWINSLASLRAIWGWLLARTGRRPLRWVKTAHAYPSRDALSRHQRPLTEILVSSGHLSPEAAATAAALPTGSSVADYLLERQLVSERHLWAALAIQHGLPEIRLEPARIPNRTTCLLPERVQRRWRVLPFEIAAGEARLATPQIPGAAMQTELEGFTGLKLRFYLVPPAEFESAAATLKARQSALIRED